LSALLQGPTYILYGKETLYILGLFLITKKNKVKNKKTQSIKDDADRINQPINEVFLGKSLKNIWGEKIKKSSAVSGKGSRDTKISKSVLSTKHATEESSILAKKLWIM
jgi:F0F1-type ATP synthase beta subunit